MSETRDPTGDTAGADRRRDDQAREPAPATSGGGHGAGVVHHEDLIHKAGAEEGLVHRPRRTDIDPKAANRAQRQVLLLFGLSVVGTLVFFVGFFAFPTLGSPTDLSWSNRLLGLGLGLGLLGIGAGIIHWARRLMSGEEVISERHEMRSTDAEREGVVEEFDRGVEDSAVPRRKVLLGGLLASTAPLLLTPIILLRDLGPLPRNKLRETIWAEGVHIVNDITFERIRPDDVPIGGFASVVPENLEEVPHENNEQNNARAKAAAMLIRMRPDEIEAQQGENWDYQGILCYSKICTHVGCPLGLYEQTTKHMLCPCHQSTFDIADRARVIFGPAARSLPQLAITVDDDGYLIAAQGFQEPVGPSFWERGRVGPSYGEGS